MNPPTFLDLLRARQTIRPYLSPTPLRHYPLLDEMLAARVYVKHENFNPTGAFKVRGGINLISNLTPEEKERGVVAASTGNHGQSIAYAAQLFGCRAIICVPEKANPVKIAAIKAYGAEVIHYGRDFDDAKEYAVRLAREQGMRSISSGDEPLLIAGVGTHTLEILEEQPDIDMVIVPLGGGSGAAGACLAAKTLNPKVEVIAVQASKAPAAYLTWKQRQPVEAAMETMAEGLATRAPFMMPQRILWDHLDDFVLVEEDELLRATLLCIQKTKTLTEPAGAAPLAAALKMPERVRGKKVALILSGGNISPEQLRLCLDAASAQA